MNEPREPSSAIASRRQRARGADNPGYAARKARVLQAAAHHFSRFGLEGAKLAAIAEDAGIDRANLYYYADGRDDLFVQVLAEAKTEAASRAETIARRRRPAADRLRLLMVDFMADVERHYPFLYVHYDTLPTVASGSPSLQEQVDRVTELTSRHFAAFRKVMADGLRSGEFRSPLSPGILAEAAIGMIAHTGRWFDPATSKVTGTEIGNGFADLLLSGLGVPGQA
jgi:AcrR family transcriptional regulator